MYVAIGCLVIVLLLLALKKSSKEGLQLPTQRENRLAEAELRLQPNFGKYKAFWDYDLPYYDMKYIPNFADVNSCAMEAERADAGGFVYSGPIMGPQRQTTMSRGEINWFAQQGKCWLKQKGIPDPLNRLQLRKSESREPISDPYGPSVWSHVVTGLNRDQLGRIPPKFERHRRDTERTKKSNYNIEHERAKTIKEYV
jgi:hypothetical protein